MKYMITIYNNPAATDAMNGVDQDEFARAHNDAQTELRASGELVDSNELSVPTAKVVRTVDGAVRVTDGPFTEGKEIIGGYYLVDCASIDRAIEIAATFVESRFTPIEIRQLMHA